MGRQIIELVQVLVDRIENAAARQQKDFRHLDEEIDRRKAAEKDRDHWRQARQDAIAAGELMKAEIETLKGAMAADDQRLRDAEERVWPGKTWGCDAADKMADEILHLRQQLAEAQQQDVDAMRAECERLQACLSTIKAHVEGMYDIEDLMLPLVQIREAIQTLEAGTAEPAPCPECAEMRGKLAGYVAENTKYTDSLQRQRDSALAQSERLWAFVGKVRTEITRYAMSWASWHSMKKALAELDAQRAPVDETAEGGQ